MWRSNAIKNTIDATLTQIGLADYLPGDDSAYTVASSSCSTRFRNSAARAHRALPFFNAPGAPDPHPRATTFC